jgi:hypothetical protein
MNSHIPASLKAEHEELHRQLAKATREPGALGDAAREVARLLHPHFEKEEQYAMPPLGLLPKLAWSDVTPQMGAVLPLTRRLKAEMPTMLMEHKAIVVALKRFRVAAEQAGRVEYEQFADALVAHAQTEEDVLYPAAILVGEYVALKLEEPHEVT